MDQIPNMYVEFGAVIAELGRQPRMARKFFEKYQDRILFGKDSWQPDEYVTYFRVLETADEYFPYHKKYHAFWRMYGMELPDEILKKVYYKNALRIIPGIDKSLFE
jgi:predicted TIM-barrel fold metal-dependent hydrolase